MTTSVFHATFTFNHFARSPRRRRLPRAEPSSRVSIDERSPEAYRALVRASEAVRAVADEAGLDRVLVEPVDLRVSQINDCAFRPHVHTRAAPRAGETAQRPARSSPVRNCRR